MDDLPSDDDLARSRGNDFYLVDFDLIDELMTEQTIALLGSDERRDW